MQVDQVQPVTDNGPPSAVSPSKPNIRERLWLWEEENKILSIPFQDPFTPKFRPGEVVNSSFRGNAEFILEPDATDTGDIDRLGPVFDKDELVDVGSSRTFLLPGDLVELTYGPISPHCMQILIFRAVPSVAANKNSPSLCVT